MKELESREREQYKLCGVRRWAAPMWTCALAALIHRRHSLVFGPMLIAAPLCLAHV